MAYNGWRVSEVPFKGILASALSANRQAFNRFVNDTKKPISFLEMGSKFTYRPYYPPYEWLKG